MRLTMSIALKSLGWLAVESVWFLCSATLPAQLLPSLSSLGAVASLAFNTNRPHAQRDDDDGQNCGLQEFPNHVFSIDRNVSR